MLSQPNRFSIVKWAVNEILNPNSEKSFEHVNVYEKLKLWKVVFHLGEIFLLANQPHVDPLNFHKPLNV